MVEVSFVPTKMIGKKTTYNYLRRALELYIVLATALKYNVPAGIYVSKSKSAHAWAPCICTTLKPWPALTSIFLK